MKIITPIVLATAVLFVAGCQQSSNTTENSSDTNATSQMETNAINTMNDVKTNVVNTATNAYMSVTNAVMTNSAATNNP